MKNAFVLLSLFFGLTAFCQYDIEDVKKDSTQKGSRINFFELKERTYVGGEFGLSVTSGSSYFFLAPVVGYDITPVFSAGISGMYQLGRYFDYNGNPQNMYAYGGGVFLRARPFEQLILQSEFDLYNTPDFSISSLPRTNVPALMAGAGYAASMSDRVYYQVLMLYDFIGNPNMPLPSIIIRQLHMKFGLIWHLG